MASEEPARNIANCLKRRKTIRGQFTHFKTFLNQQQEDPDYDRIQTRVETITEYFQEFKEIQRILEEEEPDKNHEEKRAEIEDSFHDAIANARKLLRNSTPVAGITNENSERSTLSPTTAAIPHTLPRRKLPDLDPPKFDGQIENWANFKARFNSMIEKTDGLTPSDKFEYLQAALSGKASRIIESLGPTDHSYKDAWDLLTEKYDNNRRAMLRHWAILSDYSPLEKDTAEALDDLVVTFRQQLRSLKNLGQFVEYWDTCIISLILSKVGKGTAYQWELTLPDNRMPSYNSLLEFLAKRANCSDTKKPNVDPSKHNARKDNSKGAGKPRNGQRQTYLTANASGGNPNHQSECALCKEAHYTGFCPKLKELSVEHRIQAVQRAELCLNCFRSNHKTKTCKSEKRCKICRKPHHTILHLTQPDTPSQSA